MSIFCVQFKCCGWNNYSDYKFPVNETYPSSCGCNDEDGSDDDGNHDSGGDDDSAHDGKGDNDNDADGDHGADDNDNDDDDDGSSSGDNDSKCVEVDGLSIYSEVS